MQTSRQRLYTPETNALHRLQLSQGTTHELPEMSFMPAIHSLRFSHCNTQVQLMQPGS